MSDISKNAKLINDLKSLVGNSYTLVERAKTQQYSQGFRLGSGEALAVVRPGTLLEIWQVLKACHGADVAIIMQAANTGLTGGSTPNGNDYDRPIVIISTMRIDDVQLIDNAKQFVGLAGSTLFGLEDTLAKYGREPHSVIGSSCIGASIVGGICNNSGGALVQRGPAYTELSLFAQVDDQGELSLVNNLGLELGNTPEDILTNLEQKNYSEADIQFPDKRASDNEYHERVRDVNSDTPSRYNNDGRRLHEASGCAGKLAVFAVRLDTFPKAKREQVFYVGTNNPDVMTKIRRDMLSTFKHLPVSGEYYDEACYDVGKKYGKDTFVVIDKLGSKVIPVLFSLKRTVDRIAGRFSFLPNKFSDHVMQWLSYCWPNHLPQRMEDFRSRYKLHFIIETNNDGIDEAQTYLDKLFKEAEGDFFACTEEEAKKAMLQRFSVGGAIGRYQTIHSKTNGAMMTIDVALRRNEKQWLEVLPPEIEEQIIAKFYYGHFFCHVMHQNYVMKKGADTKAIKQQILAFFDERGAEYPAEHNVGHEYAAKADLKAFYKECDPSNTFNPGIGKTSKLKNWT
jgi:D-lactate dehydrogenase